MNIYNHLNTNKENNNSCIPTKKYLQEDQIDAYLDNRRQPSNINNQSITKFYY